MFRTQVRLTEEQTRALRTLSEQRGISVAALVREAVEMFLRLNAGVSSEERCRRALDGVGRFASGQRDVSERHDEYLS